VSLIIMHRTVDTNCDYSIMKYVQVCIADDPSVNIRITEKSFYTE